MNKKSGELHKQKNLKVNLSEAQKRFAEWLDNLPDQEIDRIEWLIDEVDYIIDCMQLEQSGLKDAKKVLSRFTLTYKD